MRVCLGHTTQPSISIRPHLQNKGGGVGSMIYYASHNSTHQHYQQTSQLTPPKVGSVRRLIIDSINE